MTEDELAVALPSLAEIDAEILKRAAMPTTRPDVVKAALMTVSRGDLCKELERRSAEQWGAGRGFHRRAIEWAYTRRRPARDYP